MDTVFCIGDRVEAKCDHIALNKTLLAGDQGVVCEIRSERVVGVRWDSEITRGHDCNGKCDHGHGWRVYQKDLRHVEPEEDIDISVSAFMEILQNV